MAKMKGTWKKFWAAKEKTEFSIDIKREYQGFHWKVIENFIGDFKGLNVIELGCGRGISSLLMAIRGANVTLVDFSKDALKYASTRK